MPASSAVRITRKASLALPVNVAPKRAKPTERQRNLKSERTNIRLKGEVQKEVRRESGKISRENREAIRQRIRESGEIRRREYLERSGIRSGERQERNAAILQRSRENVGIRRGERLQRKLIEEPVVGGLKSSVMSSIMLVIMIGFGLIILYAIVTQPSNFSGALGGFSKTIAGFTQTGPLFVKTSTT